MLHRAVKLHDFRDNSDWYIAWSNVCDAPINQGMRYEEFVAWYRSEYIKENETAVESELLRVQEMSPGEAHVVHGFNRAGPNESQLELSELIDRYCIQRVPTVEVSAERKWDLS